MLDFNLSPEYECKLKMLNGFLNDFQGPPATPPRLNTSHPFNRSSLRLAAVANQNGGMTDLVTGVTQVTSNIKTETNELGATIWAPAALSGDMLSWTLFGPTTVSQLGFMSIHKVVAITSTKTEPVSAATNHAIWTTLVDGHIFFLSGSNFYFGDGAVVPNCCYFAACIWRAAAGSGQIRTYLLNMTTGQSYYSTQNLGNGSTTIAVSGLYAYESPPAIANGGTTRLAACAIWTGANNSDNAAIDNGEFFQALANPWSLWYA